MGFWYETYEKVRNHIIVNPCFTLPHSDNIVSLDVYFEDLSYDVIQQTPLYEAWALIG